jgi:hypothetical protein
MRINIIGSILLTLFLMLIAHLFNLGIFGCIILMIVSFGIMNYWGVIRVIFSNIRFRRKETKKKIKSSYEFMNLEE